MLPDPGEVGELGELTGFDTARSACVQIFQAGVLWEPGPAQALCQAVARPLGELVLDHEPQAILERARGAIGAVRLLFEGLSHAVQAQLGQLLDQRFGQHDVLLGCE
jgi:hypothetical protein